MNRPVADQIRKVAYTILGLLTLLFLYFAYIQIIRHEFWLTHSLNRRNLIAANEIQRGKILDRNGETLAKSLANQNGNYKREYPFGSILAPLIGYDNAKLGRSGIESLYNAELAGQVNPERRLGPIARLLGSKTGNDLRLTIDAELQRRAYQELGARRGAVVVLDIKTGAILASVSKPSFDPNAIEKEWNTISTASDSPLLNRTVQGLYPPGSTIKVIIADASLQQSSANAKKQFDCQGELKIPPDYVLHESNNTAHGKIDLKQALTVSCNVTFGSLALNLGRSKVSAAYERFGFSQPAEDLQELPSRIPNFSQLGNGDLAQMGIGQSSLLTTPLKMATVAAAFANKGVIMKPYMIDKIMTPAGEVLYSSTPREWLRATTPELAAQVADMMAAVVKSGTGRRANAYSVSVAGKTGTAENPHGEPHAWFIGFAPVDKPQVAIAVILENSGSGGGTAAPIAGHILSLAVR